jgi:hypothetical protein
MLFARACAELHWLHRVFLPPLRDDFLAATGSGRVRDFSDAPRACRRPDSLVP